MEAAYRLLNAIAILFPTLGATRWAWKSENIHGARMLPPAAPKCHICHHMTLYGSIFLLCYTFLCSHSFHFTYERARALFAPYLHTCACLVFISDPTIVYRIPVMRSLFEIHRHALIPISLYGPSII